MGRDSSDQLLAQAYLDHLTPHDVSVLFGVNSAQSRELSAIVRQRPAMLEDALFRHETFASVFTNDNSSEPLMGVSPFLVFALAVAHTRAELARSSYVFEWFGPRQRAPVFDVAQLQEFLDNGWRRFFLAELLSSYTHVASGSIVVRSRSGLRRRRFSELDPVRLASMLELVADSERLGIYRRLGDLALFLTGVFPDAIARRGFAPVEESRLRRAMASGPPGGDQAAGPTAIRGFGDTGAVRLLEELGRRSYRVVASKMPEPVPATLGVLADLPLRFDQARRVLNVLTERFLFAERERWFGSSGV